MICRMLSVLTLLVTLAVSNQYTLAAERPNILWVTSEDNGPHLGCYGDSYADTPNIDRLASKGTIYKHAWSNAPVCAPARTTIVSGVYPPSTGGQHMRSITRLPKFMKMYPQYLREQGYYCTNNVKEDYNLEKPGKVWDESSKKAHWRNRKQGQPFFAVFNFTTSHESQIRKRPHTPVHDPQKVRVPAYHPDTKEVRQDWAQYYDKITEMDAQVGDVLKQLEDDGLANDTIVFYYGDHGSGMPRSKRSPCNSGLHVPMIVSIPPKFQHLASKDFVVGGKSDRLVAFIDLAPTVLSLAGIEPPAYYQGHAFLGKYNAPESKYLHGFRGRMDERYDMARSIRNERFVYVRNYMPHRVYGQYLEYMFQTPTTRVWKEMFDRGQLNEAQSIYWQTKPTEELYDLENDPDEIHNLIGQKEYNSVVNELRVAQQQHALEIRDLGFLPEHEMHARSKNSTPYEMGHDPAAYPLRHIMRAAIAATLRANKGTGFLEANLTNSDSAVRYWAATGYLVRETADSRALLPALEDESLSVRVVAAEALALYGNGKEKQTGIDTLLELANVEETGAFIAVAALNSLAHLPTLDTQTMRKIEALPLTTPGAHSRVQKYTARMITRLIQKSQTAN